MADFVLSPLSATMQGGWGRDAKRELLGCVCVGGVQNRVRTFSTWPPSSNQLRSSRSQLTAKMIFKASTVSIHAYWVLLTSGSPRKLKSPTTHHASLKKTA